MKIANGVCTLHLLRYMPSMTWHQNEFWRQLPSVLQADYTLAHLKNSGRCSQERCRNGCVRSQWWLPRDTLLPPTHTRCVKVLARSKESQKYSSLKIGKRIWIRVQAVDDPLLHRGRSHLSIFSDHTSECLMGVMCHFEAFYWYKFHLEQLLWSFTCATSFSDRQNVY